MKTLTAAICTTMVCATIATAATRIQRAIDRQTQIELCLGLALVGAPTANCFGDARAK